MSLLNYQTGVLFILFTCLIDFVCLNLFNSLCLLLIVCKALWYFPFIHVWYYYYYYDYY